MPESKFKALLSRQFKRRRKQALPPSIPPQPSPLCKPCTRLQDLDAICAVPSMNNNEAAVNHHDSFASIVRSAEEGCPLCRMLMGTADFISWRRKLENETGDIEGGGRIECRMTKDRLSWEFREASIVRRFTAMIPVFTGKDDPIHKLIPGRLIHTMSETDGCMDVIKDWLSQCQRHHRSCQPLAQLLPTRVIDVGSSQHEPYLHISGQAEISPWITLSHCWGVKPLLTTTLATLDQHCKAIPMVTLPQTFRDAVTLVRNLGFKYLWIDSLCIIQDSHDDWRAESVKMHSIYSNSALCISASAARGSDEGIFASANKGRDYYQPLFGIKCYSVYRGVRGTVYFGNLNHETASLAHPYISLYEEPIHQRAWVFQESVLSPRRLDFGSNKLHWACREAIFEETNPQKSKSIDVMFLSGKDIFSMRIRDKPHLPQPTTSNQNAFDSPISWWYIALKWYVSRNISNRGDLLPAIAGIALIVKERTKYNYVCGLWREDIHRGLLWTTERIGNRMKDDPVPSWSWASLNIPMTLVQLFLDTYWPSHRAEIMEINVETEERSEFAPVLRASLKMRGNCMHISTAPWRREHTATGLQNNILYLSNTTGKILTCRMDEEDITDLLHEELKDRRVLFFQVAMFIGLKIEGEDVLRKQTVYGLLLEPFGSEGEDVLYKRIGIFEVPKTGGMADGWEVGCVEVV